MYIIAEYTKLKKGDNCITFKSENKDTLLWRKMNVGYEVVFKKGENVKRNLYRQQ